MMRVISSDLNQGKGIRWDRIAVAGLESAYNLGTKYIPAHPIARECVRKLITRLESNEGLQTPFVFDGPNGIGKTFALQQILNWFKKDSNYFVVEVPSAIDWVVGKYPYQRAEDKWEQPYLASVFLKKLLERNKDQADQFKTKSKYQLGEQIFQKGTPYSQLLDFGSSKLDNSSKISQILFQELQNNKNVLVAVDNINAFFSNSKYFDEESNKIHSSAFLLPRAVLSLFHTKSSAKVVGALTKSHQEFDHGVISVSTEHLPPLSNEEIMAFSNMYKRNSISFKDQNVHKLKLLSGGNPRKLFDICRFPLEL